MSTQEQIQSLIEQNKVVLFMKGTKMFPQCGFSSRSVEILKRCGVQFKDVNVLADNAIRQGIKDFSNWPTIPQIYVDGKFIGGSDILHEMYENGELQQLLGVAAPEASEPAGPPALTISDKAKDAFRAALKDAGDDVLRFDVSASFSYDLYFGPKAADDYAVDVGGLVVHVSKRSAGRANGTRIDYLDGPDGAGFKIDNPNEPPSVKNVSPRELKGWLDKKEDVHLFDVRGDNERILAKIDGAHALDVAGQSKLESLPKNARIVLHCHHGVRSKSAGEQLLKQGFTNVHSLIGGIDAWSAQIDPSVPRY
jgi:monothiol glutaredoxin